MLFDAYGKFDLPFYAAGGFYTISGIVCLPLRQLVKYMDGRAQSEEGSDMQIEIFDEHSKDINGCSSAVKQHISTA